ncbi:MAG TPA: S8 family serine peptidase [Ignavibacteriaceae bacterium]|nr:S8 family serine peptidase [Ignavibacteriaceae bacterium]
MKKVFTLLCLLSVVLIFTTEGKAQAGNSTINPYLQVVLLDAASNDMIDVYATLKEQYSFDDLRMQTAFLPKKERQKEVVRILREYANVKQQDVRNYLESAKQQNLVSKMDILWAANTVVFSAVPQVIYHLAENFDEIAEIRYDPQIDESLLIDPIEDQQTFYPPNPNDNPAPQIGLVLINAPAVWAAGDSGQGVLAANHDSGCFWAHPDLINQIWHNLGEDANNNGKVIIWNGSAWVFDPGDINGIDDDGNGYIDDFIGWDFQGNDNNPGPAGTHGTNTAGIICGDGTNGTQTGVAPRAKLINCKLSGESTSWLAIQYSVAAGVDVITSSHSYKWYFSPKPNYPMHRQMNDFEMAAGVVHTNSTSNDGGSLGSAPIPYNIAAPGNSPTGWIHPDQTLVGGLSSIIGVGNVVAQTDIIASSSPYGPSTWEDIQSIYPSYPYPMPLAYQDYPYETLPGSMGLLKPDVSAPGNGTTTTADNGGYASFSGTSGATPHACGTAALLLSINPNLTPADVSMILQTTAVEKGTPGKDPRYGAGRIDAYAAYLLALSMIPVELSSFSASANENSVTLNWSTATETNNSGFSIERKTPLDERWIEISFVPGFGTTTERMNYTFKDENLNMGNYSYRLKQIDFDGTIEYSIEVFAEVGAPQNFALMQNYPNPFNPSTTIEFSIPQTSNVKIEVYNIIGELVVSLINQSLDAGYHRFNFDASSLPSGTYVYQLKASGQNGTFVDTKKMLLMK